jgi:UDPglucose 6-dehydrogenase
MMKNIAVAGTGYVGLTTGTCFADLGNRVTCIDINPEKIAMLERGEVPIYEPGLSEMITRNVKAGRLIFTTDYKEALADAEYIFICVGTPSGVDGEADLRYVRMAAETIAQTMTHPIIIVNKSTVPVGTGDWVADIVHRSQPKPIPFDVVSCPEFMREGSALYDFVNPDRVVLGSKNKDAAEKVAHLHLPLRTRIIVTDLRTAEMIKYASNAFLATKISFINEIATICEKLGADVHEVAIGMGYDKRIGPHFLNAGLGYGGSCFPKDVKALEHMALVQGSHPALLRAVMDINRDARRWVIFQLRALLGLGWTTQPPQNRVDGTGFQAKHRRHSRVACPRNCAHVAI